MRISFDNGTPNPIARGLVGHEIVFARQLGWHELKNCELLRQAEEAGFELLLHSDNYIRYLLSGTADAAIRFDDLCHLLESLGFEKRVRGSHHIFRRAGIAAKVNMQRAGAQAKPYQVNQVRAVILKAKLGGE